MPLGTLPADVLDFADVVLPPDVRVNGADPQIEERLWHLANTVANVHLSMKGYAAGRFLAPLCLDLGELGWALRAVLRPEERDETTWRILTDIAEQAGLERKFQDRNGYLSGLFWANCASPERIASFFRSHYTW